MKVENKIDTWLYDKKNRGFDTRQGVANGITAARLEGIAFGELILAPVAHADILPDGKGTFLLQIKPTSRWVVCWGEFCADNSEPVYRKNWWGKRIFVCRIRKEVPVGGKILRLNKVSFYWFRPLTGIELRTYVLKKDKWIRE